MADDHQRLLSLDAFRGLAMASMILVNNPGSWSAMHGVVRHAEWGEPLTPTDLIFPFFLLSVGLAIPLALGRRLTASVPRRALAAKILRRGAVIFILGVVLYLFPRFELATMRIPGVLQRIAVVYVVCALAFLVCSWRGQLVLTVVLLMAYWLALTRIPIPGHGAPLLAPDLNLAAWLDCRLLAGHLLNPGGDPEGILSTLSAVATGLIGLLAGQWMVCGRRLSVRVVGLVAAGVGLLIAGTLWGLSYAVVKDVWTGSYVLVTGGVGLVVFAGFVWLVDLRGHRRLVKPLVVYGANCLAVYAAAHLGTKMMVYVLRLPAADGGTISAHSWIYRHLFASWLASADASLLFSVGLVLFWLVPLWFMYDRKVFIKI